MKKVFVIAIVLVLAFACVVPVVAAGAINTYEQNVLDTLGKTAKVGNATYKLPSKYINAAKNYFLTIDMTKAQSEKIIEIINKMIALLESQNFEGTEFDLSDLDYATKLKLLNFGNEATEEVGVELTYVSADGVARFTNTAGEVVFENEPVIRTTGSDMNTSAVAVVVVVMTVCAAAAVVISKKAQLF